jgi:uncharacterized membrane protein YjjP (DUF1212 family)
LEQVENGRLGILLGSFIIGVSFLFWTFRNTTRDVVIEKICDRSDVRVSVSHGRLDVLVAEELLNEIHRWQGTQLRASV